MSHGPIDPTPPKQVPHSESQPEATQKKQPPPLYGASTGQPMTFLGMRFTEKQSKELWTAIMEQVNTQIQQNQKRMLAAIRKLKKSETGEE